MAVYIAEGAVFVLGALEASPVTELTLVLLPEENRLLGWAGARADSGVLHSASTASRVNTVHNMAKISSFYIVDKIIY